MSASLCYAQALLHASGDIVGRGVGHRLHSNGVVATQWGVSNLDSYSLSTMVVEHILVEN